MRPGMCGAPRGSERGLLVSARLARAPRLVHCGPRGVARPTRCCHSSSWRRRGRLRVFPQVRCSVPPAEVDFRPARAWGRYGRSRPAHRSAGSAGPASYGGTGAGAPPGRLARCRPGSSRGRPRRWPPILRIGQRGTALRGCGRAGRGHTVGIPGCCARRRMRGRSGSGGAPARAAPVAGGQGRHMGAVGWWSLPRCPGFGGQDEVGDGVFDAAEVTHPVDGGVQVGEVRAGQQDHRVDGEDGARVVADGPVPAPCLPAGAGSRQITAMHIADTEPGDRWWAILLTEKPLVLDGKTTPTHGVGGLRILGVSGGGWVLARALITEVSGSGATPWSFRQQIWRHPGGRAQHRPCDVGYQAAHTPGRRPRWCATAR